jgi:ParB-like chromosome segregation protein Spo0J
MYVEAPRREIVTVPILSVRPGESPRLEGEDKAHIARLAETETSLPPILVDRRGMRVIDGMHRLMAASLNGQETITIEFFDGNAADAFLRAVEANVTNGLPLSRADRRAAAVRIIASHPHMSDRAIAESAGLSAKTVAAMRCRSTDAVPQLNARVGRDGKVRPLNNVEGRQRAAALMAKHPTASLREVARGAGISPATVRDVRLRLERGQEPVPARSDAAGARHNSAGPNGTATPKPRGTARVIPLVPTHVLEKLQRDPSLRYNEKGRRLLWWLRQNAVGAQEWSALIATVPPHRATVVAHLARQYSQMWLEVAQELDDRARAIDSLGARGVVEGPAR